MTQRDKQKWDQRYSEGARSHRIEPNEWLLRALAIAKIDSGQDRRALDVACGNGRNALYLAALGFEVDAVDISPVGLAQAATRGRERGLTVNWLEVDLDFPFDPPGDYNLIVMIHYINMPLLEKLSTHLQAGGWLVCEEHLQTDAVVIGPQNPEFRLAPGVLAAACGHLRIHHQEEGIFVDSDTQQLALTRVLAERHS